MSPLTDFFEGNYFLLIFVIIVMLIICMSLYNELSLPKGMPPGPLSIPIVGHLPLLGYSQYEALTKLGKKYGPIFRLFVGNSATIVLNDYSAVKEAFLTNAEIFSGRPKSEWVGSAPGNENIIGSDGIYWRDHRRFTLTLMRDCGVGKSSIQNGIMDEIHNFISHLIPLNGKPTDISNLLGASVANNVSLIIIGKKYPYTDSKFVRIRNLLCEIPARSNSINIFNFLPWLEKIPGSSLVFKQLHIKRMAQEVDAFMAAVAKQHIQNFNDIHNQRDDYPNAFLSEQKVRLEKNASDSMFSEIALVTNMRGILGAGTETTTTTLLWGLIYMMLNPHIQKKVQEEIDNVIGSERNASWNDRHLTPYTEATIFEIQRISSIVPTNLPHRNKEECKILGYTIPKNSFIISNLYNVLNDPKLWKDPETFRPERFITENGTVEKPEYFIPFGIGKRQCMGEILARMELYLYFTTLLQHFTFKSPEGVTPRMDHKVGTVRSPKYFLTCAIQRKRVN